MASSFIARLSVALLALSPALAVAQQQLDPAMLQRLLSSLEQQRNAALNQAAIADAKAAQLADEVKRLQSEPAKPQEARPKE